MNPLTNMRNVLKLSEQELAGRNKTSWHDQYKDSAWIFIGGLPYDLSEGDIICIFSQYGEIIHLNLVRDKDTGKSRGFGFVCYEDQRSSNLSVDNLNGIKILNRTIRVDHVSNYKVPKSERDKVKQIQEQQGIQPQEEETESKPDMKKIKMEIKKEPIDGRETLKDQIQGDIKLPLRLPIYSNPNIKQEARDKDNGTLGVKEVDGERKHKKAKKSKSKKSKKSKKKKKRKRSSSSGSSSDSD